MENVGDGSGRISERLLSRKCSHHNVFFYQLLSWEEKIKKILFSKDITEVGRLGDHIRDHAFYGLVDEIY